MILPLRACVIRSWSLDDAAALPRYANNRRIAVNLRDLFPYPYTRADAERFLAHAVTQQPETDFAIATADEVIGGIGLRLGIDIHRRTAEIGYWLAEPFWGRGVMSEAVAAFTAYAFWTFDLVRIFAEVFANNPASARVLEKAGFLCEGRLRARICKEGRILDALLYARLREDQG
jgi:RimJ/RimL family protein N-acetyltransferase